MLRGFLSDSRIINWIILHTSYNATETISYILKNSISEAFVLIENIKLMFAKY